MKRVGIVKEIGFIYFACDESRNQQLITASGTSSLGVGMKLKSIATVFGAVLFGIIGIEQIANTIEISHDRTIKKAIYSVLSTQDVFGLKNPDSTLVLLREQSCSEITRKLKGDQIRHTRTLPQPFSMIKALGLFFVAIGIMIVGRKIRLRTGEET